MASNDDESKTKKYTCEYEGCSASFTRSYKLICHIRLHTNERPYICTYDDCDKSYTKFAYLKRHEETHEGKYRCTEDGCDQTFISTATLKKHIDNVHLKKRPKKYKCSLCDQEFNKHSVLLRHEYRHTDIKPYQCAVEGCGKRFINPSKLKRHIKIHDGYACAQPDCKEVLPTWTLFVKHKKVAHPKIHKCEFCEKQFSSRFILKSHLETHQLQRPTYVCSEPHCSRFYFIKRNLKHHIESYHRQRSFKCSANCCYKAFKTQSDLDAHLSQHDPQKRLRKRKKKRKHKPSFAAVLAGVKEKESETDTEEVTIAEVNEECLNINEEKQENDSQTGNEEIQEDVSQSDNEEMQEDVSQSDNEEMQEDASQSDNEEMQEDALQTDNETEKDYTYDDIQTLSNMVNKRNNINSSTNIKSNCISLQA